MLHPRSLTAAGFLVTAAEAALGAAAVVAHGPIEVALYLFGCAAGTALVTAVAAALLRSRGDRGGGNAGAPAEGPEPPWWPGFEADFWRRVREGERTRV